MEPGVRQLKPQRIIGVVGGVASGKTSVARQFEALGAKILDGDVAGHQVLKDPDVREAIHGRWGDEILDSQGEVDRGKLARIVFADPPDGPKELAFLEQWTHPRIARLLSRQAEQMLSSGAPAVVLDAAVMLKAGWDSFCDTIIFVDVPTDVRLARARERGWSELEFARREAAQEPLEIKRARADVVIDNSAPPDATRRQVEQFWQDVVMAT